jgi:hypothetical protein
MDTEPISIKIKETTTPVEKTVAAAAHALTPTLLTGDPNRAPVAYGVSVALEGTALAMAAQGQTEQGAVLYGVSRLSNMISTVREQHKQSPEGTLQEETMPNKTILAASRALTPTILTVHNVRSKGLEAVHSFTATSEAVALTVLATGNAPAEMAGAVYAGAKLASMSIEVLDKNADKIKRKATQIKKFGEKAIGTVVELGQDVYKVASHNLSQRGGGTQ